MSKKIKIKVGGMHCTSCSSLLEKSLIKVPGVSEVNVSYASEVANITLEDESVDVKTLEQVVKDSGYKVMISDDDSEKNNSFFKSEVFISLLLSLPLFYLMLLDFFAFLPGAKLLPPYAAIISLILTTPIQFIIGRSFYQGFLSNLKMRSFGMDTLIALGTSVAYFYSFFNYFIYWQTNNSLIALNTAKVSGLYFETSAFLITFVLVGKFLEDQAKSRGKKAISKLLDLQVKTARVWKNEDWEDVSLGSIVKGDIILVRPGEKVPVDGEIVKGHSLVDEAIISGESFPQEKKVGDKVIGSTLNKNGSFEFIAQHVGTETMLARIVSLVEEAQGSKAPIQDFADKVATVFVPIIVFLATLSFIVWYFIIGSTLPFALMTFVSVIVIACPCALGLATPMAIMVGTAVGAKSGILIKGGEPLQIASEINTIVFDKTGTITEGKPRVKKVISFSDDLSVEKIINIAASLEKLSEHPLSEAIIHYHNNNSPLVEVQNFEALSGYGLSGEIKGVKYYLGNEKLISQKINLETPDFSELKKEALTLMILADDEKVLGVIAASDPLKKSSVAAIKNLKKSGFIIYLLSGDNKKTAEVIANEVGIDHVIADVLPADKADHIKKLQLTGSKVAMVGDGINDAPALAQADLAIVMGSGADISLDIGGIVIVSNDVRDIAQSLNLSKETMKKIRQNMFFALFYNVLGIPLSARLFASSGLILNPELAGLAMALSSLSVVLSSLTLRYYKPGRKVYQSYILLFLMLTLFIFLFWEFAKFSSKMS